jgi:hypothetical protein
MIKDWQFEYDSKSYHVQLEMDFTTRRDISVNGRRILEDTPFHNLGSAYEFEVDGIPMEIVISRGYFRLRTSTELYVRGEKIEGRVRRR